MSPIEELTKVEFSLNSIDSRLTNPAVLFDPVKFQKLLKDLLAYLISFDTVHTLEEAGLDMYKFPSILKHLLMPLIKADFITLTESSCPPKFLLIQINNQDINATSSLVNDLKDDTKIAFDGLNVFLHYDTVDFKGILGGTTAYYNEAAQELSGRGACDDKGQLAAMIITLYRLYFQASRMPGYVSNMPLNLFVFADEEIGNLISSKTVSRIEGNIIDAEPTSVVRRAVVDRLLHSYNVSGVANTIAIAQAAYRELQAIYQSIGMQSHFFTENGSALAVLYISVLTAKTPLDCIEEIKRLTKAKLKEFDVMYDVKETQGIRSSARKDFTQIVKNSVGYPVSDDYNNASITSQTQRNGSVHLWGHYNTAMFQHNPTGLVTSVRDLGRHTSNERVLIPELYDFAVAMENTYYAMQEC